MVPVCLDRTQYKCRLQLVLGTERNHHRSALITIFIRACESGLVTRGREHDKSLYMQVCQSRLTADSHNTVIRNKQRFT